MKPLQPGRFQATCPGCAGPFSIRIDAEPGARPVVEALTMLPTLGTVRDGDPDATLAREVPAITPVPGPGSWTLNEEETLLDEGRSRGMLDADFQPPRSLGGYRVDRKIGLIRVGAAYEGRRKATGRAVALAIVKPRWAADARFVARFAREAFASAQLSHPNLLPPEDFDISRGFPFAASGAVEGLPLSDPTGRGGLDRSARVAAILHAARGLRRAHEQGIYHRDVSLAKIRVEPESGLVRLADLGVNLTPDTPEGPLVAPIALADVPGAPPARNPNPGPGPEPLASAFARDDIAGLGRALKSLIGGNQGERALTPGLAVIVRKMAGDEVDDRFPDLGAAIRALEAELGLSSGFTAELENSARRFADAPLARLRPKLTLGFVGVLGLFAVLTLLLGRPLTTAGVVGFAAIVGASMTALRGITGRDPIFDRARELVLGGGRNDLLTGFAALALVGVVLTFTGLLGTWIFLAILAVGLALASRFAIDRPIEQARAEPLEHARTLIRGLRRIGVDEDSIRRFACRHAGRDWEEFFEALFGYDALRSARARWGFDAGGKRRPRFAPWRDPIVDAIEARIDGRTMERDRVLLQGIEERNLEARGMNLLTARRRAHRIAEAVVLFARQFRRQQPEGAPGIPLMDALGQVALRPDDFLTSTYSDDREPPAWREWLADFGNALFGSRVRFLAGGLFLAGSLYWMHQNEIINAGQIRNAAKVATTDREKAIEDASALGREVRDKVQAVADAKAETRQLRVEGISQQVTDRVDGFGLGVAGLILLASSLFRGARISIFVWPGALIAAFGPRLIEAGARPLGPTSLLAMAIGGGLFALGVFFGRTRD
jgi:hypothetical protein